MRVMIDFGATCTLYTHHNTTVLIVIQTTLLSLGVYVAYIIPMIIHCHNYFSALLNWACTRAKFQCLCGIENSLPLVFHEWWVYMIRVLHKRTKQFCWDAQLFGRKIKKKESIMPKRQRVTPSLPLWCLIFEAFMQFISTLNLKIQSRDSLHQACKIVWSLFGRILLALIYG